MVALEGLGKMINIGEADGPGGLAHPELAGAQQKGRLGHPQGMQAAHGRRTVGFLEDGAKLRNRKPGRARHIRQDYPVGQVLLQVMAGPLQFLPHRIGLPAGQPHQKNIQQGGGHLRPGLGIPGFRIKLMEELAKSDLLAGTVVQGIRGQLELAQAAAHPAAAHMYPAVQPACIGTTVGLGRIRPPDHQLTRRRLQLLGGHARQGLPMEKHQQPVARGRTDDHVPAPHPLPRAQGVDGKGFTRKNRGRVDLTQFVHIRIIYKFFPPPSILKITKIGYATNMHQPPFNGLGMNLGNLSRLSPAESRSISAENPAGARSSGGKALPERDEDGQPTGPSVHMPGGGLGWKVRPYVRLAPGEILEMAGIEGPGAIQSIWMTPTGCNRFTIIRIYWDGQEQPSVECPINDFFASPWVDGKQYRFAQLTSQAVCVNPGNAFNCFWEMPFRRHCRITIENRNRDAISLYYQVNYTLTDVPDDAAYFHAQFRRTAPVLDGVHRLLDGVQGQGHYVGTAMGWQVNHNGWWGEGEIKFYLDGDTDPALSDGKTVAGSTGYPTICGTGTEDYFLGSYNFENKQTQRYQEFNGPFAGMPQVIRPDGLYDANTRFALYRWHIMDPIRFREDLTVTIQSLGWREGHHFHQRQDDICSVAYWYQSLPTAPFPALPDKEDLEIV